jgi:translation initiation factor IF-3
MFATISYPREVIRIQRFIRINGQIRARMVRTIDSAGKQVGILPLDQALTLARSCKLDLVEVSPNVDPPVCRVMDFGKFQYQQMKKDRQARKKQVGGKLKEIKIRSRIEIHDYNVKLRQARDFLSKGFKLRIRLFYRGREMVHTEFGQSLLRRLEEDLKDFGHVEMPPKTFGKNVVMMFGPQKVAKPKAAQEQRKDVGDAKVEDKPLGGQAVQGYEAR